MCKEASQITFILSNEKEKKLFHDAVNFHEKNTLLKGSDKFMTA